MILLTLGHKFAYEMENIARVFFPGESFVLADEGDAFAADMLVTQIRTGPGDVPELWVRFARDGVSGQRTEQISRDATPAVAEQSLARMLYLLLSEYTGKRPPWGTLTGVRPVRLFRDLRKKTGSVAAAQEELAQRYLTSREKLALLAEVDSRQVALLESLHPNGFSLYIGIPFCPSRCLYCSFVSHDVAGVAKLIPEYLRLLNEELRHTAKVACRLGLRLETIYVGGGTPTTLEAPQMEALLSTVEQAFDLSGLAEYTVEAGRPDTITAEKLRVLRKYGVGRVSVNPQSMDDDVLRSIGRNHTVAQTVEGMELAREAGFSCVNMDLIAGLPGDSAQGFASTIEQVLALAPENITVHTLTVKRSSALRQQEGAFHSPEGLGALLNRSHDRLSQVGYVPYYLYRQKATLENLQNTGYSIPGQEGLYNVLIMEELQTILAVGAGAVSKLYRPGKPLRRVFNFKFPFEYISRFPELLRRKSELETME